MSAFNPYRAWAVARKEVMHVLRDPFTLALALGLPVMLVTFFGYAIDFEVRGIQVAVADRDGGPAARRLKEIFAASGFFRVQDSAGDPAALLDSHRADAALYIEPGFSRDALGGRPVKAQFVLDGSDNSKGTAVVGYLPGIQRAAAARIYGETPAPAPLSLETRFLFNPELSSRWFMVPGLAVIIIGLLCIVLTAMTVAREWENGSMELLLSTPVRPPEIIIGKLAPYGLLVLAGVFFVYLAARLVFGVPFTGSHLLFLAACLLFILASLAQGLFISVAARQQQVAMQVALIIGLLPSMLLSGFIFPVESMPTFFQYFTMILPPRWFMEAARGIFLKGSGLRELAVPMAALAGLSAVLLAMALKKFKTDLEP